MERLVAVNKITHIVIWRTDRPRTKSGKRSSVSWQIAKTPPDGASLAEDGAGDVITLVEQENLNKSDRNTETMTATENISSTERPKSSIISKPNL